MSYIIGNMFIVLVLFTIRDTLRRVKVSKCIFFTFIVLIILSNVISAEDLSDFSKFAKQYGWDSKLVIEDSKDSEISSVTYGKFKYRHPDDDGYYPKLGLIQFDFKKFEDIPNFNKKPEQIYHTGHVSKNDSSVFPLLKYETTCRKFENMAFREYGIWKAYRKGRRVYVIYKTPTRQKLEPMFSYLVSFFRGNYRNKSDTLDQLNNSR